MKYNYKRNNQVILLMINDEAEKCYYFAVKNLLELYSFEWLRSKKAAMINDGNDFQNALNDALDYQTLKKPHKKYQKLSLILVSIIGKG